MTTVFIIRQTTYLYKAKNKPYIFLKTLSSSYNGSYLIVVFIFFRYDFDNDGLISREDVQMVLYYVPMIKNQNYESNDY
jgi:hypothetical protein